MEIEMCVEFLAEFSEVSDQTATSEKGIPKRVIEHPGFQASCLNRWSLELAAGNYKTRHTIAFLCIQHNLHNT